MTVIFKMVKQWEHFQPYDHANEEANRLSLPHFDSWTCLVTPFEDGVERVDLKVKILLFTEEVNYSGFADVALNTGKLKHDGTLFSDGFPGIVLVQVAEQGNGIWGTYRFEDLENEMRELVKKQLDLLHIRPR